MADIVPRVFAIIQYTFNRLIKGQQHFSDSDYAKFSFTSNAIF